jgi:hypothetical protein
MGQGKNEMALRQIQYQGMTLTAGAFEVAASGRFGVTLSITRSAPGNAQRDAKLFEPPARDALFDTAEEALEWAIEYGRAIVDGEVPGNNVRDL